MGIQVISLRVLNERIAIPVAKDGAYTRFSKALESGWQTKAFRLVDDKIFVSTTKLFPVETTENRYDTILGVDFGVKRLATVSIINKSDEILEQLYLGQDVGDTQRNFSIRRSKLARHRKTGSRYAKQALKRLGRSESNFTKRVANKLPMR